MTLDDFLPCILPRAKGCPDIIAKLNTRLAIIELCQKALIWREYQDAVTTVDLQTAYEYDPAETNQQVCLLLSLTLDGVDVELVDPGTGKSRDSAGYTEPYCYGTFTGFELRPAQASGLSIVSYAALAPSLAATAVPDAMAQYIEAIANGALSRILTGKDKEYSDMAGAGIAKSEWNDAISDAKSDALAGFARAKTRTQKVWF